MSFVDVFFGGAQRGPVSYFYEDLLVAKARFVAAQRRTRIVRPGRRPVLARSAAALRDREHHRVALGDAAVRFRAAGGEAALDAQHECWRRLARAIARERLRGDEAAGACLCGDECPARRPR